MPDDLDAPMATDAATVRETAKTLAGMERFEDGLRRRTEGLTWILLGMTLAGIGASATAGMLLGEKIEGLFLWPLQIVLPFLAWTVAGALATAAVWRSASLHAPARPLGRGRMALRVLGLLLALFVVVWPLMGASYELGLTRPELVQYPAFTVVFGLVALGVATANVLALTPEGRRTVLAVGAAQVALGLLLLALQSSHPLGYAVAFGAIPGAWFVAGLWQTLRG